jgi:hypothetical protein
MQGGTFMVVNQPFNELKRIDNRQVAYKTLGHKRALLFIAGTVGRTVILGGYHGKGTGTNVTNLISLSDLQNI